MNVFQSIIIVASLANAGLCIMVVATRWQRAANRGFAVLSGVFGFWLICLWFGATAQTNEELAYWIRMSNVAGMLIPIAFDVLRHSIMDGHHTIRGNGRRLAIWLLMAAPLAALCWSRLLMSSAELPSGFRTVGQPHYGPAYAIYPVFFLLSTTSFIHRFVADLRRASGVRRMELQFFAAGSIAVLLYGIILGLLPAVMGNMEPARYLAGAVILMDSFVAYGIATRRVMGVSYVLHRLAAYATLVVYLLVVYAVTWFCFDGMLHLFNVHPSFPVVHMTSTLVVTFSLLPAHGWVQRFAEFVLRRRPMLSLDATIEKANRILQFVTRVDALMPQFAKLIESDLRCGRVRILLLEEDRHEFVQRYPLDEEVVIALPVDGPVVRSLRFRNEPIVPDLIDRTTPSALDIEASVTLSELDAAAAFGTHAKTALQGIVLLGPHTSGRIYDAMEQRALQVICDQLGVALENAKLYTQLQDSKIYNDLIVESLASGLVVCDAEGRITVVNRRAAALLGISSENALGQSSPVLPGALSAILQETLTQRIGIEDRDLTITAPDGESTPVRVSSSILRDHRGNIRGAILLVSDMTALRKLEEQVRRTDRLSSLGTLSAGMAHEIKNPLVTIKAFTQLLPERHEDAEFRDTFFELVGQEVSRIDSIVNRLLGFSRPAKPSLTGTHLHRVIDESLQLIAEQAKSKNIAVTREFAAGVDLVQGDIELLKQAFVNFFLNAIEAMDQGGELCVSTAAHVQDPGLDSSQRNGKSRIAVNIRDTGNGIRPNDLHHVFDPFFTTKSSGTGLGLSVAHGILQEHDVGIDVESLEGEGTTFRLLFPTGSTEEATR